MRPTAIARFVSQDRNNEKAPLLEMQAIEAYQKGGFPQLVLQGKKGVRRELQFWYRVLAGARSERPKQKSWRCLKTQSEGCGASTITRRPQKTKEVADYQEAAKWYRSYLRSWPDEAGSAVTNYLLADTLFREQTVSRCRPGI